MKKKEIKIILMFIPILIYVGTGIGLLVILLSWILSKKSFTESAYIGLYPIFWVFNLNIIYDKKDDKIYS